MATRSAATSALVVALLVCGCSSHRVLVPPRLDLRPYGSLGLITFSAENAKGSLPQYATDRFSEEILSAQPGVEVLELGPMDTLLARVGEKEPGIATAQELGKQRQVGAVFAGRLKVSNPNPSGGLASFGEAIPAQAIAQVCEMTWQLRGQAEGRQVENARAAIAVNQGLFGHGSAIVTTR